jgi:hypothetical protein
MSKVAFAVSPRGSGVMPGEGRYSRAWLEAIRLIIVNVLPSPMSSARRPPRKLLGDSS